MITAPPASYVISVPSGACSGVPGCEGACAPMACRAGAACACGRRWTSDGRCSLYMRWVLALAWVEGACAPMACHAGAACACGRWWIGWTFGCSALRTPLVFWRYMYAIMLSVGGYLVIFVSAPQTQFFMQGYWEGVGKKGFAARSPPDRWLRPV